MLLQQSLETSIMYFTNRWAVSK